MHAFTVTKQYLILLQILTQTQKNSLTSQQEEKNPITVLQFRLQYSKRVRNES